MIKSFITLFLFMSPISLIANDPDSALVEISYEIYEELLNPTPNEGAILITEGEDIRNLIERHVTLNKAQRSINGYRIQIFSGSSYDYPISKVSAMKEEFETSFPNIPVYLDYFDPDFKIRVGNFKNRLDCFPTLHIIRRHYPSCYPVRADIPFEDIINPFRKEEESEEDMDSENATEEETFDY